MNNGKITMKKTFTTVVLALCLPLLAAAQGKAKLWDAADSLSYALGMTQAKDVSAHLMEVGIEQAYLNEVLRGMGVGLRSVGDKKLLAFNTGIQLGTQLGARTLRDLNLDIFGEGTGKTLNTDKFMAALSATLQGGATQMTPREAPEVAEALAEQIRGERQMRQYADWRRQNEEYMAELIRKGGYSTLEGGVFYRELEAGNGARPSLGSRVQIHYSGTLIDGTEFDNSYRLGKPATFLCNQLPAGWATALTHMRAGSRWEVYIPADQGFGSHTGPGGVKPYSVLKLVMMLIAVEN